MVDSEASPVAPVATFGKRVLEELGLATLYHSPRDTKLICIQRFVRLFAYGCSTLVLVSYLNSLGFSETRIGLFMTLTLVGDVIISFLMTMFADGLGRRATLVLGSVMMCGSGIVFGLSGNYWVLLAGSIFGVISPSGNEIGPFRAIEESTIGWLTPKENRSDIFAWYTLLGTGGTALGMVTCGWAISTLVSKDHWTHIQSYQGVFFLYAILGLVKCIFSLLLSSKCEVEKKKPDAEASETAPLLTGSDAQPPAPKKKFSIFPSISKESVPTVVKLCLLFALDSFGSALVSMAWVIYFINTKFTLDAGVLGTIFFTTSIISAASVLVASSIAKRFGNVKTMVFTHLPSAVFLALIPIPATLPFALTFMILRSCTQSMDAAPRSAFLATILKPTERTAIMGFINIVKTGAGACAPVITGLLATNGYFWVAFIMAGSLKATYDIGMLLVFASTEKEKDAEEEP